MSLPSRHPAFVTNVSSPGTFLPDHSELLVANLQISEGIYGLSILPLPAGSPRQMPFGARDASWSPNGQQLILGQGSDLYLAKHDGTDVHKLLSLHGLAGSARFSLDGTRIRFTLTDSINGSSALWEVRSDGTGLRPLLSGWNNPPQECCGKWTRDGAYYIFQSTNGAGTNLWAMPDKPRIFRRESMTPVQLTTGPISYSDVEPGNGGNKLFTVGTQPRGELERYDPRSKLLCSLSWRHLRR